MKPCAKCRAELPATTEHCIYCGAAQAVEDESNKRTMVGHPGLAEELMEAARLVQEGQAAEDENNKLTMVGHSGLAEELMEAARLVQEEQAGQAQQHYGGTPPPQQHYGGTPPPQQHYGAAQPQGQEPFGGADLGIQNAQFGAAASQQAYGVPGDHSYRDTLTEQVKPLPAPGAGGTIEVWDEALTTLLLVFGVLLIACVVAPWSVGAAKTEFAWSVLSVEGAPLAIKLLPLMMAGTGVIAVGLGALKLNAATRAFAATGVGLAPILFAFVHQGSFGWRVIVGVTASIVLIVGLVLRTQHPYSQLSRILASVGACAIIALYLIPEDGSMQIKVLLDQISDLPGKAKLIPIVGTGLGAGITGAIPLLLTALAFCVWLPGPGRGGSDMLCWTLLFWGLFASIVAVLRAEEILSTLKTGLHTILYLPLAEVAWMSLACFGIAGVIGNLLDR